METVELPSQHSMFQAIWGSGPVVQCVLILLIFLSIWSWAIAIAKYLQFKRARLDSKEFQKIFFGTDNLSRIEENSRMLGASPLVQVFTAGYRELGRIMAEDRGKLSTVPAMATSSIERHLRRSEFEEATRLERGLTFLASVASAAPFIGLFGTVWGIMNAFQGLSAAKSTTLQAVAPGISEALVATAIGLAAAIPAAVAYNYFAVAIRYFKESMGRFSDDFLAQSSRYFHIGQ